MNNSKSYHRLTIFNSISIGLAIILIVVLSIYFSFDYKTSEFERSDIFDIVNLIFQGLIATGVLLAFVQYRKKRNWEKKRGLELSLSIQKIQDDNLILIKTSVSNKTSKNITINAAYLILTPHEKNMLTVVNKCCDTCFEYTNDIAKLDSNKYISREDCLIIPLNYYITGGEKIQIGNEKLRYVKPLSLEDFNTEQQLWDVRFFVFPEEGYHRSVHSSFKGKLN